eukprot:GEMP01084898.1.p1 GENE.GEMP01084898.1~~GEMP01084898.1.p1  ORF type:complete len:119 (+),score=23.26 GEMP01084898.1:153-509(+)
MKCLLFGFFAQDGAAVRMATLPPDFWMWKTTPPPPTPPGPFAQVLWVEQTVPPLPTTPPPREACYGCDCLFLFADDLVKGGSIASDFACGSTHRAPTLRWAGAGAFLGGQHPRRLDAL